MNYLEYFPSCQKDAVLRLKDEKTQWINQDKKGFLRYRKPLESVQHLRASCSDFTGDVVKIGSANDINAADRQKVYSMLRDFMPWRKGPFSIFGIDIDSEWRSNKKWDRITPELPDLSGKIIADIGCNNGYYMFRMAKHAPSFVLGFEPYIHHYYAFQTLNTFSRQENLEVDLFGVEHLNLFPNCFDIIFLLGIIYHRPSPVETLRDIYNALKPGGTLILESQAIPGDEPVALFPEKTYAKVPGTWFVPTGKCLEHWLIRTGFKDVSLFCEHPMSCEEQRKTEWMIFESYEDFIDKNRSDLTIEKYPAPWRVYLQAKKC